MRLRNSPRTTLMAYMGLLLCMALIPHGAFAERATGNCAPRLSEYPLKEFFFADGDTINLSCNYTSTPGTRVTVRWFKATQVTSTDDSIEIKHDTESFNISDDGKFLSIEGTQGLYQCTVESIYGTVRSHWVHIRKAWMGNNSSPVMRGRTIKMVTSTHTLKCANLQSNPVANKTWYKCTRRCATRQTFTKCGNTDVVKNNCCDEIKNTKRQLVTKTGDLLFSKLSLNDSGKYCCIAKHSEPLRERRHTTSAILNVTGNLGGKVIGSPLEILYPNEINSVISVIKGQRKEVHIQALFASRYDMRVDWFKNGNPLPESQNKSDIAVNTMPDDAGIYTAVAIVIGGENREKRVDIRLEVQVPPVIQQGPVNRNVSANETGLFAICDASGNPIPTIEWTEGFEIDGKRTKKVDFGKNLPLPQHKAGTILTLSCNASNDAGYQIAEAIIQYTNDVSSGDDEDRIVPNPHFQSASCFNKSTRLLGDFPSILVGLLLPGVWQYR